MKNVIPKIDKIVGRILTHPEYSACVRSRFNDSLREESRRQSAILAAEQGRNGNYLSQSRVHQNEQIFYEQLQNAEESLRTNGVNISSLISLGHFIDLEKNPAPQFRRVDPVNPGQVIEDRQAYDLPVAPVASNQIPQFLEGLFYYLENTQDHPIVRSAQAHLEMIRIHPYFEGNSRAGRLVGNLCLEERGYPPIVISEGDKDVYRYLLFNAWVGRGKGETSLFDQGESDEVFSDFIASKVYDSSKRLLDELSRNRAYEVVFQKADKPLLISLAHKIRNYGKAHGGSVKVNFHNSPSRKGGALSVIGNIGQSELEGIFQEGQRKSRLKYAVKPLGC